MSYREGTWRINARWIQKRHLLNNRVRRRWGACGFHRTRQHTGHEKKKSCMLKEERSFKSEATAYRMWQQRVQRPELVALGPVVITFLRKPQWRHKGLEHDMAFRYLQPPVLNHVRSNLCIHLFRRTTCELMKTSWWNETSNMRRKRRKSSLACHNGHTAAQCTWCQRKATSDRCCKCAKYSTWCHSGLKKKKNAFLKYIAFLWLQYISLATSHVWD